MTDTRTTYVRYSGRAVSRARLFRLLMAGFFVGCTSSEYTGPIGPSVEGIPQASPAALDFGAVTIGESKLMLVSLSNVGPGGLGVLPPSLAGVSAGAFGAFERVPLEVAPDAAVTLLVQFAPPGAGQFEATLTISTDSDSIPTVSVGLTGTGVIAAPALAFSPSPVVFSGLGAGQVAKSTVVATNQSTGPITVASLWLLGIQPSSAFQLTNAPSLPLSLLPDAGFQFSVEYTASGTDGGDRDQITTTILDSDGGIDPLSAQVQLLGD